MACRGSLSPIHSLAVDALSADVLYAGTEAGEVLAYTTSHASGAKRSRQVSCRAIRKLGPADVATAATLGVVRGYVLVAAGQHVSVRNASDSHRLVHHGLLHHEESAAAAGRGGEPGGAHPAIAVTGPRVHRSAATYVVIGSPGASGNISVYQSLLPWSKHRASSGPFDISSIRNYVMVIAVVGVVGWQLLRRKRSNEFASQMNSPEFMRGFQQYQEQHEARGAGGSGPRPAARQSAGLRARGGPGVANGEDDAADY